MPRYNDRTAFPLKTTPTGTDSTLGVDEASGGRPVVTFLNSSINAIHEGNFDHEAYDAHVASTSNPHGVTAAQAGADPAGSAATVQTNLDTHAGGLGGATAHVAALDRTNWDNANTHTGLTNNPHGVTAAQAGADPVGSAAAVQSNLNTHTGDLGIHRALNDATTTTTNLWSASKISAEIAAAPGFDPASNQTITGDWAFTKPITLSDGGTLVATIGIDQANSALQIEIPAGSGVTQVFINKLGGTAAIRADGAITHADNTIPGDT